jgi:hypothetical protein
MAHFEIINLKKLHEANKETIRREYMIFNLVSFLFNKFIAVPDQ